MIFVFTGPTIAAAAARTFLDAVYLPPASQGDVYRVSLHQPEAIGIIDGYFERVPSVWHKEILWAMSQGIRVYGSGSMGALRAAELADFGMIGVGDVFTAFRTGQLEDDDEVALRHGPADFGYRAVSEAMVNIRATLLAAEKEGVISSDTRDALIQIGKEIFYPERSYQRLIDLGRQRGCSSAQLTALNEWLPQGQVDQKRADAIQMLTRLNADLNKPKANASYRFEHTTLWDQLCRSAGQLVPDEGRGEAEVVPEQAVIDELRLNASNWPEVYLAALAYRLAGAEMQRHRLNISEDHLFKTIVRFREQHGLLKAEDLSHWRKQNRLSEKDFFCLMQKEALVSRFRELVRLEVGAEILDHARLNGSYSELLRRATAKRKVFEHLDVCSLPPAEWHEALEWFFNSRTRFHESLHEEACARGFEDEDQFRRAVLGEYLFARRNGFHGNGTAQADTGTA